MSDRKLNMKRVRDAMIWLTLIAGISALLFFSIMRKSNAEVKTLVVEIEKINDGEQLISEKEIKQILQLAAGKTITKANIKTLNLRKLEAKLNKDKRIQRADLYFDSKNRLHAHIIQKKPIMRVIEEEGGEYYLDENGKQVPVTRGSAVRVPLVTGIRDTFSLVNTKSDRPSKLKQVFDIMKYVAKDPFLTALIEQAHVEHDSIGDIVLIPKLGREKLIFGDASDIQAKFDNLKIFYRDGMPKLGWSRYKSLNLKYSHQVRGMLANPEHPWRQDIETTTHNLMLQLADSNSEASKRLNQSKDDVLDSPQVPNFISGAVAILCDAIKADLLKADSGIAQNLRVAIQQVGENIISNQAVRDLLNEKMSGIAINLSDQYSEKVIRFISERIHEWDSREMIDKIENEVGGDLHMIRVNGVVVGAFIGLVLGIIRALVDLVL